MTESEKQPPARISMRSSSDAAKMPGSVTLAALADPTRRWLLPHLAKMHPECEA